MEGEDEIERCGEGGAEACFEGGVWGVLLGVEDVE